VSVPGLPTAPLLGALGEGLWGDVLIVGLCLGGGLAAGIINVLAGGGSLLTLPILIFAGLPSQVANGTNRVPILAQNAFAVARFSRGRIHEARRAIPLVLAATLGAVAGTFAVTALGELAFRRVLAGVLLLVLVPVFARPERRLAANREREPRVTPASIGLFVAVGFYGGFVQAGVGFLILGVTVLACGYDLVRANAVKVLVVLAYTAAVLPVFITKGLVAWGPALAMTVGQSAGGWIGAHLAIRRGVPLIRVVLVVMSVLAAAKLLLD
jgi:uncharacterized membrane protein YfcA